MDNTELASSTTKYSVLIPVYNSEKIVVETVRQIQSFFDSHQFNYEIILVNDGSTDQSWPVISQLANDFPGIVSINLLKNYGQHTSVFCAIKHASGDYLITMDDDLQNPPSELIKLIDKIHEGYDLVFARFDSKKHKSYRKMGTKVVNYLNSKIFNKPKHITLTNFRIFTKEVAKRMENYNTPYPYIPGLLLMFSSKIANVSTEHHARKEGQSNYSIKRIIKLVATLLFNYSSYPLQLLATIGLIVSLLSFLFGLYSIVKAITVGSDVQGWTSLVVLLSFINGFTILILGVLGEYVTRIMNQLSFQEPYQVDQIISK